MFSFSVKMKPVAKGRPRLGKYGAYTPAKTRKAESFMKQEIKKIYKGKPLEDAFVLIIDFIFAPNKSDTKKTKEQKESNQIFHVKKPDLDNLVKLVKDSLNGILILDDSQICTEITNKLFGKEDEIKITLIKKEHVL